MSRIQQPHKQTEKKVAGYGLHYHANVKLIHQLTDRTLFQCLIDNVRIELRKSLNNQTLFLNPTDLFRYTGMDPKRTIPNCLKRLGKLGLIRCYENGITVNCDAYVAAVQEYESLAEPERSQFVKNFHDYGVEAVHNYTKGADLHLREELLGISGSSITVNQGERCSFTPCGNNESQIGVVLHQASQTYLKLLGIDKGVELHQIADLLAEKVHFYTSKCNFTPKITDFQGVEIHQGDFELLKYACATGEAPESVKNDPEKWCSFTPMCGVVLHLCALKMVENYTTVIIEDKKEKMNEVPLKNETPKEEENEEDYLEEIRKGFEGFGKVDIIDLDGPSDDNEDKEGLGKVNTELDDFSQQVIKRADRQMRARNPYRKKPFMKVEKVEDVVACLDEVMKSPVDFFLYQFWWGIFDLYCDHYNPSEKIDEHGDLIEEEPGYEWREMIGAPLPQDEIYRVAQNAYEDLVGAVEQGKFVYGDHNEYEITFSFDTFEDFVPYQIFQWVPCTMKDKSIPALRVAIDKFYDIEAKDVFTPTRGDKKAKTAQNRKMTLALLEATDDTQLTPMEAAIKKFYKDFVVLGDDGMVDEFTDGRGTTLELGGGLPDHLLKPWCYGLPSVGYNGLTSVLCTPYKPIQGLPRRAYLFSAEAVVEWNERHGYHDTLAHSAIKE